MIRCIYCGLCEEVCPEQAIFLKKEYSITGYSRRKWSTIRTNSTRWAEWSRGLVYKWNEKK